MTQIHFRCESIDDGLDTMTQEGGEMPISFNTAACSTTNSQPIPATIMKGPEDYSAGLAETVYLKAAYFGNPEPTVAWFKCGRRLAVNSTTTNNSQNNTDRIQVRTYPGESTLVIKDLRADDSGKYDMQIENDAGQDICSVSLCVEGPPEPPGGRPYITTIDKEKQRLTLAWYGSTFDGGSMLTGYIVEMTSWISTDDDSRPDPTDWSVITSKCHSTSYIVRNLDMRREYVFRVRAQNIHGPSAPGKVSDPVNFIVEEEQNLHPADEEGEGDADSDEEDFQAKPRIILLKLHFPKIEFSFLCLFKNLFACKVT